MNYLEFIPPIGLILLGIYLKVYREKEVYAPKYLWLILIIFGLFSFIFRLIKFF